MKLKFNDIYFVSFIILFTIEVLIAYYLNSGFIRHSVGDYLSTILLFCMVKSFISGNSIRIAIGVLIVAFIVEFLQLLNIIELFNLHDYHILKIVIGSTFQITDLVAYTLGVLTILFIEFKLEKLWKLEL